ncbi:MAG: M14 family zinc carboxypeptidase, partial [Saprospiraceae bacterium]
MNKFSAIIIATFLTFNILSAQESFTPYPFKKEVEANRSVTYAKAIELYKAMAAKDKRIQVNEVGMTDVGIPLHEVIVDINSDFNPGDARRRKKNVLFINNGIHPGEPDGIDATLWLVQDILTDPKKAALLERLVLVIIPVYNIDGALVRNSSLRASQNGPAEYGFRGNGQNLDLNRDFIKCDTKNAMSFSELYTKWDPEIFIDNHVSNGADYTYTMTMLASHPDKLGYGQAAFLRTQMLTDLYKRMDIKSFPMCPYVNVWGTTPDKGLPGFIDSPRYASGYGSLFQSFCFVPETHMLKLYDQRVKATYAFMMSMIEYNAENYVSIKIERAKAIRDMKVAQKMPVAWEMDKTKNDTFNFKGYDYAYVNSEVSGLPRLKYFRDKPVTWKVPYYGYANATTMVDVPTSYILPQAYYKVVERMKMNGVKMVKIGQDTVIKGQAYKIIKTESIKNPYESHFGHYNTQVEPIEVTKQFLKGDYIIPTDQRAKRYIVETLEPQATDSYFNWNFF